MAARWAWFAALLVVLAAIVWVIAPLAPASPFGYDESDYMYAGTRGFWANYSDQNSMSLWEFVQKGLELRRDPERRGDMSQYVRASGDMSFYRHYHGPVYAYWIAGMKALGVQSEAAYRASGLILHAAGAIAIFWLFVTCFPAISPFGAFSAALAFAMNRTALVTAVTITQHVTYEFVCILTLFAAARYLASHDRRWWFATAGLAGLAFATVEIGVALIGAIVLSVVLAEWRLGRKHLLGLLLPGAGWFVAVVALVWPKGVFELNAVKGYLYLAYMALGRRTFSPIGPLEMWGDKLRQYPLEFVLPLVALVGMIVYFRRSRLGPVLLPFLVYAVLFGAVTMVVTLPYTYYHGSLTASLCVVLGAAIGELWTRLRQPAPLLVLAVLAVSLVLLDRSYVAELRDLRGQPNQIADILRYADKAGGAQKLLPFYFVPILHYYHPEIQTTGYDVDWTPESLTEAARAAERTDVVCNPSLCDRLVPLWPAGSVEGREVVSRPPAGEPLDALRVSFSAR